jgi:hypothetical protein
LQSLPWPDTTWRQCQDAHGPQLQVSASGSACENQSLEGGSAVWQCYSRVQISFTITQPFSYSLQATTTLLTNSLDNNPSAFVALGHGGAFLPIGANPDIAALTPNGAGTFLLTWSAPQTGNYRVLSSTNLTDWIQSIPAASRPSGPNTNRGPETLWPCAQTNARKMGSCI